MYWGVMRDMSQVLESSAGAAPSLAELPDEIRDAIVETALKHHLVSKHTSLVAIDKTPARALNDALRKDQVPNLLAYGQNSNAIFGFPATATNARQIRLIGTCCILAALMLMMLGRRRREMHHAMAA